MAKNGKSGSKSVTVKQATLDLLALAGHRQGVRQSRLDRAAVPERLA
ncbi:hypothetical protein ACVW0J_002705 [Bradyrhizobium sp. i1.7.7]